VLTDLDEGKLKEVAAALGEDRVLTVVADVQDLSAMQSAVDKGTERFGGIDVVMANAGIATYGTVLHVDPEAFRTLIDVNVVGSAHMSWIDTPLVRDSKADVPAFREMLNSLPGPRRKTTSVEKCGEAFVAGIEARKTRIYCPGWVGLFRWLKPVLSTRVGEAPTRKTALDLLPKMDAEVAALGRSMSARSEALEKH
jgi:NAD(P)-dependent dehydrogenase (short-subunit alcohol dehydrogenase family)